MTIYRRRADTTPAPLHLDRARAVRAGLAGAGSAQLDSLEVAGQSRLRLVRLDRHGDAQGDELFEVKLSPLTMRDEQQRNAGLMGFERFPDGVVEFDGRQPQDRLNDVLEGILVVVVQEHLEGWKHLGCALRGRRFLDRSDRRGRAFRLLRCRFLLSFLTHDLVQYSYILVPVRSCRFDDVMDYKVEPFLRQAALFSFFEVRDGLGQDELRLRGAGSTPIQPVRFVTGAARKGNSKEHLQGQAVGPSSA